jgi:hypothetical protein
MGEYSAYSNQAVKMYLVPAVLIINWSGISLAKAVIASNPVQWVGTI